MVPTSQVTPEVTDLAKRVVRGTDTYFTFVYGADGRRVEEVQRSSSDPTSTSNIVQVTSKVYDDANPTGYSQVLESRTATTEAGLATATPTTYVLGMDVVGQWQPANIVFPAHRHAAERAFGHVVVDAQPGIRRIDNQRRPLVQRVADGLGDGTSGQHLRLLRNEPQADLLQDWRRLRLT